MQASEMHVLDVFVIKITFEGLNLTAAFSLYLRYLSIHASCVSIRLVFRYLALDTVGLDTVWLYAIHLYLYCLDTIRLHSVRSILRHSPAWYKLLLRKPFRKHAQGLDGESELIIGVRDHA